MFRRLLVVLLAATIFTACEEAKPTRPVPKKTTPQKTEAPQAQAATAQSAVPSIEDEAGQEYAYSPIGKRDPFRSVKFDEERAAALKKKQEEEAAANAPKEEFTVENVRCGALCKWDLEQFKLVAIITGTSTPFAMLEAPDGSGFQVHRGSFIGKRSGKISQIRPGEIIVTEIYRDNAGVPQPNDISIPLPKSANDSVDLDGEKNLMNAEPEQN